MVGGRGAVDAGGVPAGGGGEARDLVRAVRPGLGPRLAVALLIAGVGLLNAASAPWAHAIGIISLLAFIVVAVRGDRAGGR